MKRSISPAVVLFLLSPAIAELLSGSSPPAEFFNPFTLVLLTALYSSGAILARELTVRWRKGWASLLALGAAYGILEKGLMVKSFFDLHFWLRRRVRSGSVLLEGKKWPTFWKSSISASRLKKKSSFTTST